MTQVVRRVRMPFVALLMLLAFITLDGTAMAQRNNFNRGAYQGGRGNYYGHGHGYDDRYQHQGGIGPGKGALIGGAGGAVLGAVFGGGLKGALVGGAAGAGIGAIAGKVHQDNQRRDDYYRR